MKQIKVRVWYWNPNGTNDIEIVEYDNSDVTVPFKILDTIPEALFGVNTGSCEFTVIPIKLALKQVAMSPVSDGTETIAILNKYINKVNHQSD